METRRLTRSQAAQLGLTPTKEVFQESAKKPSARKSSRKTLADRTNDNDDSPVSGLASTVSKGGVRLFESTPLSKLRPLSETGPETPGEDVLRTQVQSLLSESSEEASSPDIQSLFTGGKSTLQQTSSPTSGLVLSAPVFEEPVAEPSSITKSAADPQEVEVTSATESVSKHQEVEVTSVTESVSKLCEESRQSEDEVVVPHNLYVFSKPTVGLATVQEEEHESHVTEAQDSKMAQATEQTGTSEADSAAQISSNENNLTINVAESCDWVGRAIENMESFDEDIPECVSDVDSECSNPEVVDPSPPGENLQAEAGLACDQPINNAATVRTLPPLQQQPRKSPQKVKFVDESKDYEAACDHYEDFGEESLEYESEYAKGSEDLCRGLSGISMHSRHGSGVGLPEYSGTHVRFNYNSDDEAEEEEVPKVELLPSTKQPSLSTSSIMTALMRFKGIPTPKGKHHRFSRGTDGPAD